MLFILLSNLTFHKVTYLESLYLMDVFSLISILDSSIWNNSFPKKSKKSSIYSLYS